MMISRNLVFLGIIIAVLSMNCFVNSQIKVIENQKEKKIILLTQDFGWSLRTVDTVHYTGISGNTIGEIFDCLCFLLRDQDIILFWLLAFM